MIIIKIQIKALSAGYLKKAIAFIQKLQSLYNKKNHLLLGEFNDFPAKIWQCDRKYWTLPLLGKMSIPDSQQAAALAFQKERQRCTLALNNVKPSASAKLKTQSSGISQTPVAFVPYIVPEDQRFQKNVVIKTQWGGAFSCLVQNLHRSCTAKRTTKKQDLSRALFTFSSRKVASPFSTIKDKKKVDLLEGYFVHLNKTLVGESSIRPNLDQVKHPLKKYKSSNYSAYWQEVLSLITRTNPEYTRKLKNTLIFIDELSWPASSPTLLVNRRLTTSGCTEVVQRSSCESKIRNRGQSQSKIDKSLLDKNSFASCTFWRKRLLSIEDGHPKESLLRRGQAALPIRFDLFEGIRQTKDIVDLTKNVSISGTLCLPFQRKSKTARLGPFLRKGPRASPLSSVGIRQKVLQYTILRSPFKYKKSREQFEQKYIKNQLMFFFLSTYSAYHYIQALKKLELPGIELSLSVQNS